MLAFYDGRIAPYVPSTKIVRIAIAGLLTLALWPQHAPQTPPELAVSKTEVVAGKDSYTLSIEQMPRATVSIRYSIDGSEPQIFSVRLNSRGAIRIDVPEETRKGVYRLLEFRSEESPVWTPSTAVITVK